MTNKIKKLENVFEFVKVTEHYGYKMEIEQNGGLPRFVIYRIGKQEKNISICERMFCLQRMQVS